MKLIVLIDQIISSSAGSEQHVSFLMHKLPQAGIDTSLFLLRSTGYNDPTFYHQEPHILDFGSFKSINEVWRSAQTLAHYIRKNGINVVYTFFPDSEIIGMLACHMARGCRHVAARRNQGYLHSRFALWRTRFSTLFIDNFIANCLAVKQSIANLEWIQENKISIIPNPVNEERFRQRQELEFNKADIGISPAERVVGIVATLSPVKDHETFIRAAKHVHEQLPDVRFIMVGIVPSEKRKSILQSITQELGLTDHVSFINEVNNPVPLMRIMDIGVLCSTSEGLSNTLIEYAAVGLPIVATRVGGNPEVVYHGKNGFLVPPSNPEALGAELLKLLKDDGMRRSFGEQSMNIVKEKFSEDFVIGEYQKYFKLLAER